jgi:hypothetical protein
LVAHSRRAGAGLGQDLGVVYESGAFVSDGTKPPRLPIPSMTTFRPRVRCRASPWIERNEGRRSILDLFEGTMVLLVGKKGDAWPEPALGSLMRNHATSFVTTSKKCMESVKPGPCWSGRTATLVRALERLRKIPRGPCMRRSMGFSRSRFCPWHGARHSSDQHGRPAP